MLTLQKGEPFTVSTVEAIRTGNLEALQQLLSENPALSTARIEGSHMLLHVAADWPSHFSNGASIVAVLVEPVADPNASSLGLNSKIPLHWAARSNNVEVLDVLIDAGADIEAPGTMIGGGTPRLMR